MNILPKNTILGYLKFYEIYDDFEGPKCFSAKDRLGQIYLVYWCGDYHDEFKSTWLYTPISHKRLDNLRREEFSIREVFINPEQIIYYISTFTNERADEYEFVKSEDVSNYNLPPDSFFVVPDEIQVVDEEANWNFELRIAKKSHKSPDRGMVTKIMDSLSEIIESLMMDDSREIPKLFPVSAVPGSFILKLGTNNNEKASVAIEQLNAILSDEELFDEKLKELELDPYKLKDLLDIVNQDNLILTLKSKTKSYLKEPINVGTKDLSPAIKKLEESTTVLVDSSKIPQANNLNRVIEIVERRQRGEILKHENIEGINNKRQVTYHTDAAYCLGLLNKNRTITSAGRCLVSKETKEAKYEYLADRFESSDFGWAWLKWAKVRNITELEPSTAYQFMEDSVKGLSKDTKKRRATTLISWLSLLQGYRRAYHDMDNAEE
ncbi:DUF6575 domain-containing protein [Catenovulum agarivorans]|uniref:DUF6575 domain-containing protein n=1 Tax=Catenovulum agarivorans TaxID=1172192 RepID=UPI0002E659F3|nr:DUF6575 domain-containing protein [Catenovulum agarivorans]